MGKVPQNTYHIPETEDTSLKTNPTLFISWLDHIYTIALYHTHSHTLREATDMGEEGRKGTPQACMFLEVADFWLSKC